MGILSRQYTDCVFFVEEIFMNCSFAVNVMRKTLFYCLITSNDEEWEEIRQLQSVGKLPWSLKQVYVYTIPRQYERNVMEMEHWKILEVRLLPSNPLLSISPRYKEIIKHYTCYNPHEGRLHVLLKKHESSEDLHDILQTKNIFVPPIFCVNNKQNQKPPSI